MRDPVDLAGPVAEPFALGANGVHLWYLFPGAADDPARDARCRSIMSEEERVREGRFAFPRDRLMFRLTRAFVRRVLSRYAPMPCSRWHFTANAHGRPEISPGQDADGLEFNVSHTAGLIGCAVARRRRIGLDVENRHRPVDPEHYGDFLSPAELRDLHTLPEDVRLGGFYTQWTLKEAFLKALGIGLAVPPTGFTIRLDGSGRPEFDYAPGGAGNGTGWRLFRLRPGPGHCGALAVEERTAPARLTEFRARI